LSVSCFVILYPPSGWTAADASLAASGLRLQSSPCRWDGPCRSRQRRFGLFSYSCWATRSHEPHERRRGERSEAEIRAERFEMAAKRATAPTIAPAIRRPFGPLSPAFVASTWSEGTWPVAWLGISGRAGNGSLANRTSERLRHLVGIPAHRQPLRPGSPGRCWQDVLPCLTGAQCGEFLMIPVPVRRQAPG
jgi:hypothetical protein